MSSDDRLNPSTRTLLIDDAARAMGVSRRTVYYRIREGNLQTVRTRCGSQRVIVRSLSWLRQQGRHRNARCGPPLAERVTDAGGE